MRRQSPGQPQDRWPRLLGATRVITPTCLALAALIAACDGQIGDTGTSFPPRSGSTASPESDAAAPTTAGLSRALRRLSAREYNNVVRDLLGDTTQPANQFGQEVYTNGFDNGSDGLTVQGTDVLAFQTAAESLAATAVASNLSTAHRRLRPDAAGAGLRDRVPRRLRGEGVSPPPDDAPSGSVSRRCTRRARPPAASRAASS